MSINNNVRTTTIDSLTGSIDGMTNSKGRITADMEELVSLFGDTQYLNAGEAGTKAIEAQIEKLTKAIKEMQKDVEALELEIEKTNLKVVKKSEELVKITATIEKVNVEQQKAAKKAAEEAAESAIEKFKKGESDDFQGLYKSELETSLRKNGVNEAIIKALYAEYEAKQSQTDSVCQDIERLIGKTKTLQKELDTTNSTIKMLQMTKDNMSSKIEAAYKNVDTDSSVPRFSGAKAELANEILSTYQSRYLESSGEANDAPAGKADPEAQKTAQNKWLAQKGTQKYSSGDKYNATQNPELMNLRNLLKTDSDGDGTPDMISDLQTSGMSINDIMKFIQSNWDVGLQYNEAKNNWTIPQGHDKEFWCKEPAYEALRTMINNGGKAITADSVNQDQMQELKKAVLEDDILTKMRDAGFTFKEAMYTLTKAFPDAGVTYNLSSQETRNYGLVADSESSDKLYDTIHTQVFDYWNVGSTMASTKDPDQPTETRSDPITFQQGDTTFTFITDRDGDGEFDFTDGQNNELLGSKNGIQELLDFDTNHDGKLSGDELNNLILMSNKQDESIANKDDVENYKKGANYKDNGAYTNSVDFNVTYTTAAELGIEEIDLSSILNGTGTGDSLENSTKEYDGFQENFEDINGSSIINQFDIKMKNGETIHANETLNTESNLDLFYGQVARSAETNSNKIFSKLTNAQIEKATDGTWADGIADIAGAMDEKLDSILALLQQSKEEYIEENSRSVNLSLTFEEAKELIKPADTPPVEPEDEDKEKEDNENPDNDITDKEQNVDTDNPNPDPPCEQEDDVKPELQK